MPGDLSRKLLPGLLVGLSIALTACGSSSGSSGSSATSDPTPGENTSVSEGVQGPLDAVQTPLSEQVLGQLGGAVAGTPLEGVIDCIDQAVVIDVLDVVDAIALALMQAPQGDPTAALNAAAENIQFALNEFTHDLPNLLGALAGGDCSGGNTGGGTPAAGNNPLAGTPLEPLGAALAPFASAFGSADNGGQDLDLTTLSNLVTALNQAFQSGLTQSLALDPSGQIESAPILGGLLETLSVALNDLDGTVQAVGIYDSVNATAGLEQTLNHLLVNVLTKVVPISFIEEQAGQGDIFSSQIEDAVTQITSQLAGGLGMILDPLFAQAMEGPLTALLDPVENTLLPALLAPITDALAGAGNATGPTGTPLDLVLSPLLGPISGGLGGSGGTAPTGSPLDILLGPIADAIGAGGVSQCPLRGTPLDPVCGITDGLLGALSLDPSADPLAVLTGLINTLLGGLGGGLV